MRSEEYCGENKVIRLRIEVVLLGYYSNKVLSGLEKLDSEV